MLFRGFVARLLHWYITVALIGVQGCRARVATKHSIDPPNKELSHTPEEWSLSTLAEGNRQPPFADPKCPTNYEHPKYITCGRCHEAD